MSIYPTILSGGAGSRLWPISREFYPKPLLPIFGDRTLLQDTASRLESIPEIQPPIFVCNEAHRFLVADQLLKIDAKCQSIVLEPKGRDTAPALTLVALKLLEKDPDAILVVMPADHVIPDSVAFSDLVLKAADTANLGYMVTFGVVPEKPETGYGYIRKGEQVGKSSTHTVDKFVEKPDESTAQSYLESGDYFWNAGIFVMRADVWVQEIGKYRPIILKACQAAVEAGTTDSDFIRVNSDSFLSCPAESIDYAVMENTDKAVVMPMATQWSDVGSWSSIWDLCEQDANGNATKGDVICHNTKNSLVFSENRCVAAVGLDDVVVVETADAVLVMDKSKSQEVKGVVGQLKRQERKEYLFHSQVHRPWGNYQGVDSGQRHQVKHITVKPGAKLSLQMHHHRAEHWIVVSGTALVTVGEKEFLLSENQSTYISIGETHRLENPGAIPLEIIEVQSGSYLGEDDIVRFEDIYNRVPEEQKAS